MRVFNRLLALIVALALIATGVILAIEVTAAGLGKKPVVINWRSWLSWGNRNTWNAASVKFVAALIALVGLIILIVQLRRRRPSRIVIRPEGVHPQTSVALTRKGLEAFVGGSARDLDGVQRSRVKLGRRRVALKVSAAGSGRSTVAALDDTVRSTTLQRLDELALARSLRLKVQTQPSRKAS